MEEEEEGEVLFVVVLMRLKLPHTLSLTRWGWWCCGARLGEWRYTFPLTK